jgi:hypothetical protein
MRRRVVALVGLASCLSILPFATACGSREGNARAGVDSFAVKYGVRPESAYVVSAALRALGADTGRALRVDRFVAEPTGVLVTLVPSDPNTLGGGGIVWVDRDTTVVVRRGE